MKIIEHTKNKIDRMINQQQFVGRIELKTHEFVTFWEQVLLEDDMSSIKIYRDCFDDPLPHPGRFKEVYVTDERSRFPFFKPDTYFRQWQTSTSIERFIVSCVGTPGDISENFHEFIERIINQENFVIYKDAIVIGVT